MGKKIKLRFSRKAHREAEKEAREREDLEMKSFIRKYKTLCLEEGYEFRSILEPSQTAIKSKMGLFSIKNNPDAIARLNLELQEYENTREQHNSNQESDPGEKENTEKETNQ